MGSVSAGGGAIYKDGEPVLESMNDFSTLTVPAGETWIVTIRHNSIDSNNSVTVGPANLPAGKNEGVVVEGGTQIDTSNALADIWGWAV